MGMAFHPEYAENGRFFVHYNDTNGDTVLAEYRVSRPRRRCPDPVGTLLTASQPAPNHNGELLFGPDGMCTSPLVTVGRWRPLRKRSESRLAAGQNPPPRCRRRRRVRNPTDNPSADGAVPRKTWAMGLRNPWRFWFDDRHIYIGDVGQNAFEEEIDMAPANTPGLNYGWPI